MFVEMTMNEMMYVDGGGWKEFGFAFMGTVAIGASLPVAIIDPPAGVVLFGTGVYCLGCAM